MSEREKAQFLSDEEVRRLAEYSRVPSGRTATCLECDGNGVGFTLHGCPGCDGHGFVRPEAQARQRREIEARRLVDSVTVATAQPVSREGAGAICLGLFFILLGGAFLGHFLGFW